jgi:Flp pilus assembly protein protease CpaA
MFLSILYLNLTPFLLIQCYFSENGTFCEDSILVIWVLFGLILLIIALNDFLFFRIEDEPVIALCVLYIISCIFSISGHNFLEGFSIALAVFVITLVLNHCDMIGGGDVKFLFPLILFAEDNLDIFLVGVSVAGILLAIIYMLFGRYIFAFRRKVVLKLLTIRKNKKKNTFLNIVLLSLSRITNRTAALTYRVKNVWRQEIPYGVALAYGGFCVILENLLSR